ncbi:MAG: hypothetical protein ACOWYE_03435 [Desulfatiglandales bacterium]
MNVIFYNPLREEQTEVNRELIEHTALAVHTEVFADMKHLTERLRRPSGLLTIAVLYAPRTKDLEALLTIKELIQEVYGVLILPDRKENTISKGHLLRPRFLTYMDADQGDVGLVLTKMIETYSKRAGMVQ